LGVFKQEKRPFTLDQRIDPYVVAKHQADMLFYDLQSLLILIEVAWFAPWHSGEETGDISMILGAFLYHSLKQNETVEIFSHL
jgi:hypothetical protein